MIFIGKAKNNFSWLEVDVLIAVLSTFSAVAISVFNSVRKRSISFVSKYTIRQINEECETNYIHAINKFTLSNKYKYQISASGSNIFSEGKVTLIPEDRNLWDTSEWKNFGLEANLIMVSWNELLEMNEPKVGEI